IRSRRIPEGVASVLVQQFVSAARTARSQWPDRVRTSPRGQGGPLVDETARFLQHRLAGVARMKVHGRRPLADLASRLDPAAIAFDLADADAECWVRTGRPHWLIWRALARLWPEADVLRHAEIVEATSSERLFIREPAALDLLALAQRAEESRASS